MSNGDWNCRLQQGCACLTATHALQCPESWVTHEAAEITRLRAELERVREAGRAVVEEWANAETFHEVVFEKLVAALDAALEGEEGK